MADVLVRNLDDGAVRRLRARAKRDGRSLAAEMRAILEQASREVDAQTALKRIRRIRARLGDRTFTDSAEIIREAREAEPGSR